MAFVKIEKTTQRGSNVDAIYRLNDKGIGTLRFTKEGTRKLNNIVGQDIKKAIELYIDRETKSLAFKLSESGQFKLSGVRGIYTLSYSDINKEIRENVLYSMQDSSDYTFVLRPLTSDSHLTTSDSSTQSPSISPSSDSGSSSESDSDPDSKSKKPRSKKK